MLGNQLLNSVSGIEEDLNRLKGWTLCTPLVKPVRGGGEPRACLAKPDSDDWRILVLTVTSN